MILSNCVIDKKKIYTTSQQPIFQVRQCSPSILIFNHTYFWNSELYFVHMNKNNWTFVFLCYLLLFIDILMVLLTCALHIFINVMHLTDLKHRLFFFLNYCLIFEICITIPKLLLFNSFRSIGGIVNLRILRWHLQYFVNWSK